MSTDTSRVGTVPELTRGWRLQMALRHADMTVQDMAEELGMARSTLSRWLNDHGAPPRDVFLKAWALRTGVPYAWLKDGEMQNGPRPGISQNEDRFSRPRSDSNGQPTGSSFAQVIRLGDYRRAA